MKEEKENSMNLKLVATLTNLLLFENIKNPVFDANNFKKLSDCFINNVKLSSESNPVELEYFREKLNLFYNKTTDFEKMHLYQLITNNDIFMKGMFFLHGLNNNIKISGNLKETQDIFFINFHIDMLKSFSEGVPNKYIFNHFASVFELIYYIEISNRSEISKREYNKVIRKLANFDII